MHPKVREPRAVRCFGLRNFVRVVHCDVIFTTAMNVKVFAKILVRHRRAFDMPARKATSPRRIPFHLAIVFGCRKLPQCVVGGVLFFTQINPRTGLQSSDVEPPQMAVTRLLRGVEVNAVARLVGVSLLFYFPDEVDLLGDAVGGLAQRGRKLDAQRLQITNERLGIQRGDVPRALSRAPRTLLHFVFAVVAIGYQMADIGDVHDVVNAVAVQLQHTLQPILEQKGAVVANVLIVVHRRPAGVEPHLARFQRREFALRARPGVIELQGHKWVNLAKLKDMKKAARGSL